MTGARGHTATLGALHAIVHPDHRRMRGRILAGQFDNVGGRNACPLLHPLRRVFLHLFPQLIESHGVAGKIIGVVQPLVDDDMHHAQRQRRVGPRIDGQVPVRAGRGAGAVRINHHQLGAFAARFRDERPQMDVVAVDIRAPRDDVARVRELLRIGAHLDADNGIQPRLARRRADVAGQLRSSQAMKEAPVHGCAIERAQRAPVGVRQNRLTAEI